jgi:hypothetical protein
VPVLDAATVAFLEGGCGLMVAVVSPDGAPCVARAWGLTVLERDPALVRLLLPADDTTVLDYLRGGAPVAVTGGNVRTYRSIQLKGRSLGVEEATEEDRARGQRYIDAFFADLFEINGMPRELCDRFIPVAVAACMLAVEALYDQTPGPGAGAALAART